MCIQEIILSSRTVLFRLLVHSEIRSLCQNKYVSKSTWSLPRWERLAMKKVPAELHSVLSDYLFYILVQILLSWTSIKPFSDQNRVCRLPVDSWANSWLGNDTLRSSGLVYTGDGCFCSEICSLVHRVKIVLKGHKELMQKLKMFPLFSYSEIIWI